MQLGVVATLLLLEVAGSILAYITTGKDKCSSDRLANYRMVLHTHWTKQLFPKQYPEVRPPAQWSKLVGRSHDASFSLYRESSVGDQALHIFSSTGQSDGLEAISQRHPGVLDEFSARSIPSGHGSTDSTFFSDGNHSRVSVVVRMIPSPDWFIGLDSIDLCHKGYWIDTLSLEVGPMDAGADDGFTFSAPNWPSEPRQKVTRITSRRPSHPANSFYYPDMDRLPAIATFHFYKEKVYQLSGAGETLSQPSRGNNNNNNNNAAAMTVEELESALRRSDISNDVPRVPASGRTPHKLRRQHRRPLACRTSPWGPWTPCSVSCGVGESSRTRTILHHARRGGRPCPPLAETRWCGDQSDCPRDFFNW